MLRYGGVLCATLLCVTASAPALAQDLVVGGFFSQRAEIDRDVDLSGPERRNADETTLRSITNLGLTIRSLTDSSSLTFAPGVRLSLRSPRRRNEAFLDRVQPRVNAAYTENDRLGGWRASFSVVPESASVSQFEDTGRVDTDATQISIDARLARTQNLDPLNSLTLAGFVQLERFTENASDLIDTDEYGLTTTLRHSVTPLTGLSIFASARRFVSDRENNAVRDTFSLRVGGDTRLSPRLEGGGSIGLSFVRRESGQSDETPRLVGNLDVSYAATATDNFTASISQTVDQNSIGDVESRLVGAVGWSRRLTQAASFGLSLRASTQTPVIDEGGDTRDTLALRPTFNYALTNDWNLSAGVAVQYFANDNRDGLTNRAFLQFSRGLSLLP